MSIITPVPLSARKIVKRRSNKNRTALLNTLYCNAELYIHQTHGGNIEWVKKGNNTKTELLMQTTDWPTDSLIDRDAVTTHAKPASFSTASKASSSSHGTCKNTQKHGPTFLSMICHRLVQKNSLIN